MRISALFACTIAAGLSGGCAQLASGPEGTPGDTVAGKEDGTAVRLPEELLPEELIGIPEPARLPDPLPPARPTDLWERVRDGFALPGSEADPVQREQAYFAANQGYIDRVAERAEPYLHHIVEQVESRGMPTEIALLPIVESAFRPFAYSHGRAAGIWQFIPATGRHYGLEQNWWYDGRRDVIAATEAALTYLERLSGLFDGDWLLAVAAYNAGEGNVLRAVRRNERLGRPTDFWHLDLPSETRTYVPRLLALRNLVRDPEVNGISLPSIPNEPRIETVELESQIDLALAAELAGISIERLYRLNPGYNRWATAPSDPQHLVLPLDRVERFEQALADTPPEERLRWQRHRIASGETLIQIARRYHTTVDMLQEINDIRGNVIRAGQHLIVPVASRPEEEYALSASQRQVSLQQRRRSGRKHMHVVRPGETLLGISRRYGVSVRELGGWNQIAPGDTLQPGQKLAVWAEGNVSPVAAGGSGPSNRLQSVRYTVRSGDSLYLIAKRFNVTVSDLRRWNDLSGERYLQPGQKLRLKVDVTAQSGI